VIGAYHRWVAESARRFDCLVAKYMGDGVPVCFGYRRAHEDHAERAVRAGLDIVAAVAMLDASAIGKLEARIGIATGLRGGRRDAEPGGAAAGAGRARGGVIAARTRALTGGPFDHQNLGAVEIRGLAVPVAASRVLRESGAESHFPLSARPGGSPRGRARARLGTARPSGRRPQEASEPMAYRL
jgi:class 3 adenylate cyclase